MPPYKSTYSLSSTESPTSLTVPISPFSASSASDSIYTSDEQPDLGAFTTVLRELVHMQPPPRIPAVAHNHHLRRRDDFTDSRSEETTITDSTTLTSTGTGLDTDIERRSTVWNQQPIADYLRVSSVTSDGAESDVEEGPEESDTEGARTVEIESATEMDDDDEEEEEDDIDEEDADDDEGNLESEIDPSIQSQPAPSYLSVSSTSTEPDHDHEPEDVSPDHHPSLGYLDKTLNFIAAERARWSAQRGSMLLDGSHTPRRPETWSHVIEPRRKRKRRRSDRPDSLARTAGLLSRAQETVERKAEKRRTFSDDNDNDQDPVSEPSSHSTVKPKSKSKSVPASPFTHDSAFDHEPTDKTTVVSDVPSSTPRTRTRTRKKHKLRAASRQDDHPVMQILTRPEPLVPPSPPPRPAVLHLEAQGVTSGPETGGDAASTSGPEALRIGSHIRRRRRPKTRQALDANNLAGHSLYNLLSNKNAQTTNASTIKDSSTKLPHSSTSHATHEGHRLFNLVWQLGRLFPKDKLALDDILDRMKEVDNSGYNNGLDEGERNNLLDPRGRSPKGGDALVHIFIDHSNILIGLLNYHKRHATPKRARNRPTSLSIDATGGHRDSAMPPASLPPSTSAASPDRTAAEAIAAGMTAIKNSTRSEGEGGAGAGEYDTDNVVLERPTYLGNRVLHQGRSVYRTAEGKDDNDNSTRGSNLVQSNMKAQAHLELSPIIIENTVEGVNVDGRIGSRRKAATSPSIYAESSSPSHATIFISRASSPSSSMLTSKARTETGKSPESTPDRVSPSSLTSAVTLPSALSIPHTPIPLPSFATAARVVYSAGTGLDTPVSSNVTANATDNTRGSTPSTTPTHTSAPLALPRKRAEASSTKPHFSQGYPSPASSGVQTTTLSDSATRSNLTGDSYSIPLSHKSNDTISASGNDVAPARSVEESAEEGEGDVMLFNSPRRRKGTVRRLSHTALTLILERGRPITRRVLVTSSPLYQPMDTMERLGYEVRVYIRVPDLGDGMDRERHYRASEEKRKKRHSTSAIGSSTLQSTVTSSSQPEGSREHRRRLSESISADSAGVISGDAKSGTLSGALGLFLDDARHSSVPTSLPNINAEQSSSVGVSHPVDHGSSATTTTSLERSSHPHSHVKHHLHQHVQHQHPHAAAALLAYTQSKWHTLPAHTITGQRIRYREQGVDELLQLKLHQAIAATDDVPKGATIVLATGDGNVGQFSEDGFLGPVRTALKRGWNIELYAWEEGLSRAWRREFGEDSEWGRSGKFRIIALEQFADSLLEETELAH